MSTATLHIDGMSCGHCVARVTKTLAAIPGASVEDVQIGTARLSVRDPAAAEAAIAALREAGYDATLESH